MREMATAGPNRSDRQGHCPVLWSIASWVLLLLLTLMVTSCVPPSGPQPPGEGEAQDEALRIALLPILDVLPYHVALQNGYFAEEGITVEGIPVRSAQERDTLMQTGQVDVQLTDLIGPVAFNQETPVVKVVYTARRAYPDSPMFRLLAGPGSGVSDAQGLKEVPVGISQNTVIEYLTERMLQGEGLAAEDIAISEISAIPVRFELLVNDEIPAATLPDPLGSAAIAAGATPIIDDSSYTDFAQSVLVFSTEALQNKPDAVRKFVRAWDRAAGEINANPEDYQDLLIEVGRVPESVQGTFEMPPFPQGSITSRAEMQDVVNWMMDKGRIDRNIPYEELVDGSFLPDG